MEGGDNAGGANNDVGGGASSGAAADPSAPSDGAAAGGGGSVVDNRNSSSSSRVVEDGYDLTATKRTVHSKNGTPVAVKIVQAANRKRVKTSWVWQVMHEFEPSINGKNVICSACEHLMSWVPTSGTTGMAHHYRKKHPALYAQIVNITPANAKADVSEAIANNPSAKTTSSAAGNASDVPSRKVKVPTTTSEIPRYLAPKMSASMRDAAHRRYVLWCAINLRPQTMRYDEGYKLHVGALSPSYVETTMPNTTFDSILSGIYTETCDEIKRGLRLHRESCVKLGYFGPFLGAQLDLTTVANEEYITFSVSYIAEGDTLITRVGLATRAFPGSHTAADIESWIEKLTTEFFGGMMGEDVTPKDVFLAFTVGRGGNVVNVCTMLGVAVIKCNAHRLNSVTMWALGKRGSVKTCKNPGMEKLMKRLAAVVEVFSHSAVNNDEQKEIEKLQNGFREIYDLIRRNDTRWTTQHAMMARILKLKRPIDDYFRRHSNARKLTSHEWRVTNEVCSLLDVVAEVTIKIQGGDDTHIGQTMFNMMEIKEILAEEDHNIRKPDQAYDSSSGDILKGRMGAGDLSLEAQLLREVLLSKLEKKELGMARVPVERMCALLDPRRKGCSAEHLVNGNVRLQTSAIDDVMNLAKTFVGPASSAAGGSGNGGAGGGDGSIPPEPKKQKVSSDLEERRLKRLAQSKASNASGSPSSATTGRRSATIEKELRMYLAEDPHLEENNFSLLQFWLRRSKASTCAGTGEVEPGLPYLALIARLYNGVESTSCQAERNFSSLSFLIGSLRSSISPGKVERLMFLRLNRLFIPDLKNRCREEP